MLTLAGNFIDGAWRPAVSGRLLGRIGLLDAALEFLPAASGQADVVRSLAAAERAAADWRRLPWAARLQLLSLAARAVGCARRTLALAETWAVGGPLRRHLATSIPAMQRTLTEPADLGLAGGGVSPTPGAHAGPGPLRALLSDATAGAELLRRLAPALAAGHSLVLAVLITGPLVPAARHMLLSQLLGSALPPGVCNVLFGAPAELGSAIVDAGSGRLLQLGCCSVLRGRARGRRAVAERG